MQTRNISSDTPPPPLVSSKRSWMSSPVASGRNLYVTQLSNICFQPSEKNQDAVALRPHRTRTDYFWGKANFDPPNKHGRAQGPFPRGPHDSKRDPCFGSKYTLRADRQLAHLGPSCARPPKTLGRAPPLALPHTKAKSTLRHFARSWTGCVLSKAQWPWGKGHPFLVG